jgi:hypothetical protein
VTDRDVLVIALVTLLLVLSIVAFSNSDFTYGTIFILLTFAVLVIGSGARRP